MTSSQKPNITYTLEERGRAFGHTMAYRLTAELGNKRMCAELLKISSLTKDAKHLQDFNTQYDDALFEEKVMRYKAYLKRCLIAEVA